MAPNTAVPTDPDALLTDLNDPAKLADIFGSGDPEKIGSWVKNYATAVNKKDAGIAEQTKAQVQAVLAEWLKDNEAELLGNTVKQALPGRGSDHKGSAYNKRAPGAKVDGLFEDTADFLQSTWHHADRFLTNRDATVTRHEKLAKHQTIQNSFGSVVPADGGFLIPETMRAELLRVALESAVVRPRATVIPMESLRVPIPMIDSTSNVSSVYGGVIAYWTEESAALTESQGSFGRVVLDAKKLTAFAVAPNELVADASAFSGFIDSAFPQALAWYEDVAFMKGSGVGEPLGFIGASNPATVTQTAETGQGANTLVWENIVKMYARMLPSSLSRAVWIADIATFPQLATMALSVGTGGAPVWLNNGVEGPPMSILGRPVIFTEKANTLGTAGDINFVDLSYYLIGDRQSMMAASSTDYRFGNDQTAYRVIERVDGRPWLQSAITPQNGGNTLSAFVNLSSTRT
jgi:HK97 family phage major capsid protein